MARRCGYAWVSGGRSEGLNQSLKTCRCWAVKDGTHLQMLLACVTVGLTCYAFTRGSQGKKQCHTGTCTNLHLVVCAARVQQVLAAETVAWKQGILVMPPIVHRVRQSRVT